MKNYLFFVAALSISINESISQTIASARSATVGSTVTVRGIVTNGSELGTIRYFQDATGGLNAFGAGLNSIAPGDSIVVVGTTSLYNNLLQILPVTGFTVLASARPLPVAAVISPAAFAETVESTLIRINNCTTAASGTFSGNTNYTLTSASQTFVIRIDAPNTNLVGTPIPTGPFDIIGLAAQFCTSPTTGCNVGYQLHPRTLADIIVLPTSLNEREKEDFFLLYPNPANDFVYIKTKASVNSITIIDIQGRTVYSAQDNATVVDVNKFAPGLYNIIVKSGSHTYYSKFSVQ